MHTVFSICTIHVSLYVFIRMGLICKMIHNGETVPPSIYFSLSVTEEGSWEQKGLKAIIQQDPAELQYAWACFQMCLLALFFFLQLLWRSVSLRVLTHAIYDHSSYLPAKWLVMVDVMNSRSVAFEQHLARLVSFAKWSQTSYFFFGCAVKCWIEFIYVTAMNTGY